MFITVFRDFINAFAGEYKLKLAFLVILSTIAAGFEFLGLSLIYAFAVLLGKGNVNIPCFSSLQLFDSQNNMALLLGALVAFTYILKDIFMIAHTNYQNATLKNICDNIFKQIYRCFLEEDYLVIRKIAQADKFRILSSSIPFVMHEFIGATLSLFANIIVALGILSYLFIKFNTTALIIGVFIFCIWHFENIYFKHRAKKYGELLHKSDRFKSDFILSTLTAQKDVLIYNKAQDFNKYALELQKEFSKYKKITDTTRAMPTYVTEIGIMSAFVLFIILLLINNTGSAQIGAGLAAIAAIILRIVPTINKTQTFLHAINSAKPEAQWLLKTAGAICGNKNNREITEGEAIFTNTISLKDIDFYYDKNTCALKNINLEIKKGEFIGIIGASGSGKTTLFNILCGLFAPQKGVIEIDNTILDGSRVKSWQNNVSILPQDFSLPFRTVVQNVTLEYETENLHPSDFEKVKTALKNAEVLDEIKDLNTDVNELSEGQKHRVALARVFYFNREIIMLDEATSALDVETEDTISKSIDSAKGQKTIIAIAHRLKTLKNCDRLIYMDDGQIIGTGTFDELAEKYPSFKKLIELSQF